MVLYATRKTDACPSRSGGVVVSACPPATAAREQVLLKLFANLGRPVPEASRPHYLALSDDAFAWAFRKRWRGIAPPLARGGVNSSPLAQNPKQGMRLFQ